MLCAIVFSLLSKPGYSTSFLAYSSGILKVSLPFYKCLLLKFSIGMNDIKLGICGLESDENSIFISFPQNI
jgi:hypothetical protein